MKKIAVMGKGNLYIRIVLFTRGDGNRMSQKVCNLAHKIQTHPRRTIGTIALISSRIPPFKHR